MEINCCEESMIKISIGQNDMRLNVVLPDHTSQKAVKNSSKNLSALISHRNLLIQKKELYAIKVLRTKITRNLIVKTIRYDSI